MKKYFALLFLLSGIVGCDDGKPTLSEDVSHGTNVTDEFLSDFAGTYLEPERGITKLEAFRLFPDGRFQRTYNRIIQNGNKCSYGYSGELKRVFERVEPENRPHATHVMRVLTDRVVLRGESAQHKVCQEFLSEVRAKLPFRVLYYFEIYQEKNLRFHTEGNEHVYNVSYPTGSMLEDEIFLRQEPGFDFTY